MDTPVSYKIVNQKPRYQNGQTHIINAHEKTGRQLTTSASVANKCKCQCT